MKIYTKTGDDGTTGLYGGTRVRKSDPQVSAYGEVDELTSFIGLVAAKVHDTADKEFLISLQRDLYRIMAVLAGQKDPVVFLEDRTKYFEQKIDEIQSMLPELIQFVLPGGNEETAWLHILRVITRRAERSIVDYVYKLSTNNQQLHSVLQYLNRLSDLFFVMARKSANGKETLL